MYKQNCIPPPYEFGVVLVTNPTLGLTQETTRLVTHRTGGIFVHNMSREDITRLLPVNTDTETEYQFTVLKR